jgi:hypothetical protein
MECVLMGIFASRSSIQKVIQIISQFYVNALKLDQWNRDFQSEEYTHQVREAFNESYFNPSSRHVVTSQLP